MRIEGFAALSQQTFIIIIIIKRSETDGEFPWKARYSPMRLALSGNRGKFPEVEFVPLYSWRYPSSIPLR